VPEPIPVPVPVPLPVSELPAPSPLAAVPGPRFATPPVRHLAHRLGLDPARLRGTGPGGVITRADVEAAAAVPQTAAPVPAPRRGRRSSPMARRLAAELGVDLAAVTGTGPDGAVVEADVRAAARPAAAVPAAEAATVAGAPPAAEVRDRGATLRRAIGALMSKSKKSIPHYYLSTTIDLGRATDWLTGENARRAVPERLLLSVVLIKATALALREVPELNARWADGQAHPSADIHVGVAISLRGGGLVAPALHGTDRRTLDELMADLRDLVKRARAGTLRSSELSDSTITVTSLGEQGVESVFGIIYPPQVAILGFGRVMARPWVVAGQVVSRPLVTASLSADHRVTDGHRGGLFLTAIERLLQEPARL
jgi:pyruvate dehydrogenase E2 component (dihydrolipoamide acetyltransferase)